MVVGYYPQRNDKMAGNDRYIVYRLAGLGCIGLAVSLYEHKLIC